MGVHIREHIRVCVCVRFSSVNIVFCRLLTVVIVLVILAVHLERNGTVGAGPALDADTLVFAFLQSALTMPRAAIFAASC